MIRQITIWTCEVCGHASIKDEEVESYQDPVIYPPNGENWDYIDGEAGKEFLACPSCCAQEVVK